jgi:hypothetical protein
LLCCVDEFLSRLVFFAVTIFFFFLFFVFFFFFLLSGVAVDAMTEVYTTSSPADATADDEDLATATTPLPSPPPPPTAARISVHRVVSLPSFVVVFCFDWWYCGTPRTCDGTSAYAVVIVVVDAVETIVMTKSNDKRRRIGWSITSSSASPTCHVC